jgi:hypothetical protein
VQLIKDAIDMVLIVHQDVIQGHEHGSLAVHILQEREHEEERVNWCRDIEGAI